jgi:hypothetical protein
MSNLKKYILVLFSFVFAISLSAQTVFKTPSGAKYHLASCRMVKNVSEEITINKAKELGLQPCKICKPENIYQQGVVVHKAHGQNKTVQCRGFTKAGTRCKHMTSIANGFCYQHQPK